MNAQTNIVDRILGPRTAQSAMSGIRNWDRKAGSMPLLSEQLLLMRDGPMTWSTTHTWPSVREAMISLGLARELDHIRESDGWITPRTEITEIGREVRAELRAIAKAEGRSAI
ncbi:MAG: hypothetical protein EOS07_22110 [Mesorhizobium sp.]|nr:MAG: hypothetical protein EOS07_22110 [Mesorhizobium sp.]